MGGLGSVCVFHAGVMQLCDIVSQILYWMYRMSDLINFPRVLV